MEQLSHGQWVAEIGLEGLCGDTGPIVNGVEELGQGCHLQVVGEHGPGLGRWHTDERVVEDVG